MKLDLAATGRKCVLRGDPWQLRPYSHIQQLAVATPSRELLAKHFAWP